MSADNGVYILKTESPIIKVKENNWIQPEKPYEYRVAYCFAIENIQYSHLYIPLYFSESPVFFSASEAEQYAEELAKQYEYLEYGIQLYSLDTIYPNLTKEECERGLYL